MIHSSRTCLGVTEPNSSRWFLSVISTKQVTYGTAFVTPGTMSSGLPEDSSKVVFISFSLSLNSSSSLFFFLGRSSTAVLPSACLCCCSMTAGAAMDANTKLRWHNLHPASTKANTKAAQRNSGCVDLGALIIFDLVSFQNGDIGSWGQATSDLHLYLTSYECGHCDPTP